MKIGGEGTTHFFICTHAIQQWPTSAAVNGALEMPHMWTPLFFEPNTVVSHTGALPDSKISNQVPSPGVGL